jgi:hypothetical protein
MALARQAVRVGGIGRAATPSYRDRTAEFSRAHEEVDGPRLIVDVVSEAFRK